MMITTIEIHIFILALVTLAKCQVHRGIEKSKTAKDFFSYPTKFNLGVVVIIMQFCTKCLS